MSDLLAHNLELLRRRFPDAARQVEEAPSLPGGAVVAGRGGEPTLSVTGEDGREILLHSRYDPRGEAVEQLSQVKVEPLDTVILLGVGLGYQLEALLQMGLKLGPVIVAEKDPAVFREAIGRIPLEDFVANPEAELILGGDATALNDALGRQLGRVFGGPIRVLVHPPSARAYPSYYDGLKRVLGEFSRHGAVVMRSALYLSRISLENRLENLVDYVESPGIKPLLGRFQGFPAVVVSAGPSLDGNVELLSRLKGRAVIIAVSTALKILLGRGIRPDFTVVIDYHPISARYFEGIPREDAPPLVSDLKATPEAVRAYSGKKFIGADSLADRLLEGAAGEKGAFTYGSTVAHAAFGLASSLGCDPIIFIGQDLSYPEGKLHATGSAATAQQLPETNSFYTLEMKEWEYYLLNRQKLLKVPGAQGGEVWTCDIFLTYLREFEKLFRESPRKIIDATEGGARKEGAEVMRLEEVIEKYGGKPIPPELFEMEDGDGDGEQPGVQERLERSRDILREKTEEAEELGSHYRRAIRNLEKIVEINRQGMAADELVAKVIAMKEEFGRHELFYYLLNQLAQADLLIRQKKDRHLNLDRLQGVPRQLAQAERDLEYVKGLRGALEFFLERMRMSVVRLGERIKATQKVEAGSGASSGETASQKAQSARVNPGE